MPRAQRIAFICPRFSEKGTVGGAETLLKALSERAAANGRDVDFLTTCATDHFTWANSIEPGERTYGKLRVHFFPVNEDRNISVFNDLQHSIGSNMTVSRADEETWISNSVNSRALIDHLKKNMEQYDRIVMGPYLYGIIYEASFIAPEKTIIIPCLHDEPFAKLSIIREMMHCVGGIIFNTAPEKQLAQTLHDTGDRGTVVGMGIEAFAVDTKAFSKRHGITQPYVVYSGRRELLKGTPLLTEYMHAFRQRTGRDVHIVFTGSGHIEAPAQLEDAITDAGFVSEQEKHEAMAGAVCFIHPSVNESLGIVLLEAWLAGTPALVHAYSKVLRDQCERSNGGLWFRNYPEFEEALTLMLDNADARNGMAVSGRNFVLDQYSWEAVEQRLFNALDGEPAS